MSSSLIHYSTRRGDRNREERCQRQIDRWRDRQTVSLSPPCFPLPVSPVPRFVRGSLPVGIVVRASELSAAQSAQIGMKADDTLLLAPSIPGSPHVEPTFSLRTAAFRGSADRVPIGGGRASSAAIGRAIGRSGGEGVHVERRVSVQTPPPPPPGLSLASVRFQSLITS